MAKTIKSLVLALLLAPTLLMAQGHQGCGCGEVTFTGEALYWAPSQCDFFFAARGEAVTVFIDDITFALAADLQNQVIEPGYDWGLRVGIQYTRDCWFARARYLWLETNARQTVLRGDVSVLQVPLFPSVGDNLIDFDTATGSTEEVYQNFDVSLGREVCRTCRAELTILGSGQGLCIRDRRRVTAAGETLLNPPLEDTAPINGEYRMDVSFLGLGLGFGGMGRVHLGCGLSFVGEAQFLGLVGYKRAESVNRSLSFRAPAPPAIAQDERFPSKHTSRACTMPGVQGSLALEYCHDLCCGTLCAHIGYETHYYYGVVDTNEEGQLTQDLPSNTQALTENAGFGGLNLGLTYSY